MFAYVLNKTLYYDRASPGPVETEPCCSMHEKLSSKISTASFDAQGLQTAADKTAAAFVPAWAQKKIIYNPLGGPEAPNAI